MAGSADRGVGLARLGQRGGLHHPTRIESAPVDGVAVPLVRMVKLA